MTRVILLCTGSRALAGSPHADAARDVIDAAVRGVRLVPVEGLDRGMVAGVERALRDATVRR